MKQGIVLGIDGGGTYTRVAAADLAGNVLGFSKQPGSNPRKNKHAKENVRKAIMEVLQQANCSVSAVQCIVGGFAGLDRPDDKKWASEYLNIQGLDCLKIVVNDAEVAQYGAFLGGQGILAIAGTGSIVLGKTEAGSIIRNYDFHHHSEAAARYLSYFVIYEMITQNFQERDFIQSVLAYWETNSVDELRLVASKGFAEDDLQAVQKVSGMAGLVTSAASNGNKIAFRACEKVIGSLVTGIELVASMFYSNQVPLALVGGVINVPFMKQLLQDKLGHKNIFYQTPQLSPVLGAVLYSFEKLDIPVNQDTVDKLVLADNFY